MRAQECQIDRKRQQQHHASTSIYKDSTQIEAGGSCRMFLQSTCFRLQRISGATKGYEYLVLSACRSCERTGGRHAQRLRGHGGSRFGEWLDTSNGRHGFEVLSSTAVSAWQGVLVTLELNKSNECTRCCGVLCSRPGTGESYRGKWKRFRSGEINHLIP